MDSILRTQKIVMTPNDISNIQQIYRMDIQNENKLFSMLNGPSLILKYNENHFQFITLILKLSIISG